MDDLAIGAVVLKGADNWRQASWARKLLVWLFARRDPFSHLDAELTIAWFENQPYLLRIQEAD